MKISSRSATRVDFAGGTLDCWPLYALVGDCCTVNLAIDVYTGCELNIVSTPEVHIHVQDLNYKKTFKNTEAFLQSKDPELILVQKVIEYAPIQTGFQLSTYSKSPVGGGLGGSSSLCISLLKALMQFHNTQYSLYELVTIASNIEAKIIHALTGTQDYFPAIQPGLNIIHYSSKGPRLETVENNLKGLEENLFLVYTGRAHHSGINNWQVIKSVVERDANTIKALKDIAIVASEMAQVCRKGDWKSIPELFRAEFDARVRLSPSFSSPEIQRLEKIALGEGAEAVKICGAGGGGCVLVWANPDRHARIQEHCLKGGYLPIAIRPVTGSAAP